MTFLLADLAGTLEDKRLGAFGLGVTRDGIRWRSGPLGT